jgi:hypothetical protein
MSLKLNKKSYSLFPKNPLPYSQTSKKTKLHKRCIKTIQDLPRVDCKLSKYSGKPGSPASISILLKKLKLSRAIGSIVGSHWFQHGPRIQHVRSMRIRIRIRIWIRIQRLDEQEMYKFYSKKTFFTTNKCNILLLRPP